MNAAIPQIQAAELYNDYLVNLASSGYAGKDGQKLGEFWREQAMSGLVAGGGFTTTSKNEMSLATAFSLVRGAFRDNIRD